MFLLVATGIPSVAVKHFCIYCKCSKQDKLDLHRNWSMSDPAHGSRLTYLCSEELNHDVISSKKVKENKYSIVNRPLFESITPFEVVLDHLHLFLRITNKLFNLLIADLRAEDKITQQITFVALDRTKIKHVSAVELALQKMGISFEFSVNKDTRKLEYRDLTGPEKQILLANFKASDLIGDKNRANNIPELWDAFSELNEILKSKSPNPDDIHTRAENWG